MKPSRGEVWAADLDGAGRGDGPLRRRSSGPGVAHDRGESRAAVVISDDTFNHGPAGLLVLVPITTRPLPIPTHVPLAAAEGGVKAPAAVLCEGVRSVSAERLGKRLGKLSAATLAQVEDRLRVLMGL